MNLEPNSIIFWVGLGHSIFVHHFDSGMSTAARKQRFAQTALILTLSGPNTSPTLLNSISGTMELIKETWQQCRKDGIGVGAFLRPRYWLVLSPTTSTCPLLQQSPLILDMLQVLACPSWHHNHPCPLFDVPLSHAARYMSAVIQFTCP